jgi:hypothetical protein
MGCTGRRFETYSINERGYTGRGDAVSGDGGRGHEFPIDVHALEFDFPTAMICLKVR